MITIQELSKQCGVSVSTVSKALNGYSDISDKTRELVIKTANEMGYFPNANARALKLKKTFNIGVLFTTHTTMGLRNDYFAHVLSAFKEESAKKGYDITFIENYIGRRKMTYLEHCQFRHFDGVCIVCADYEDQEVVSLASSDFPVVTIDYAFNKTNSIISDNYGGMKQLTNYIIQQGHTKIAYIHGVKTLVTKNRIEGYLSAMADNKVKVPKEYVIEGLYRNPVLTEELAAQLLAMPNRPTCIIAPDDQSAVGVINAIRKQGLQVVKDVSVAGYDGLESQQMIGVRLTTVKQERDNIGKEASRRLVEMIENPQETSPEKIFMKQTLLIGNSVKKLHHI
ncbi:LacI family DNA-binding transcriptional regulator [Mobilitalea sibirica]|uniref:LacI family DNA-binding transcriptional regulator n=1 Tax=Mobilitalea sibirica TaxID=1462919 RepID=A0A8J7KX10_9FIRM|nr:LacI family DNA-binding transcriptional regulator [Mobilitalea sibirica]MBH1941187.1 LacI family DNA-binding transcriptional regulator [Mobilitalea sibirica]